MTGTEDWRAIPGYEDWYEVSSLGRVRRVGQARGVVLGRVLISHLNSNGYPRVSLCAAGASRRVLLHRIVTAAFLGPCPAGMVVNHKDRNKTNAALSNLEYIDQGSNIRHSRADGWNPSRGENHPHAKLTEDDIRIIRASSASGPRLAKQFGVHPATIDNIRRKRVWAHVDFPEA